MSKIPKEIGGVTFHNPSAFWFGIVASAAGVLLHLPMYLAAADMHYHMAGMSMDFSMKAGMILIIVGLLAGLYGLYPGRLQNAGAACDIRIGALDEVKLNQAHVLMLVAMALAVTIDVMKPTTLAFVLPGMAKEYGLKSPLVPTGTIPAALLPLSGITGTVLGSFIWGWLGDRIGRRASILFAGILFIDTSICGAMPDFWLNLLMCFLMGLGVGGMLPIAYTLVAETVPARHRGVLMVLIGGDIAAAYIATSWLSAVLIPLYSWRVLWLLGLPTGLLLILLNRWIPESPRFLVASGHVEAARAVMRRFGAKITNAPPVQEKASGRPRSILPQALIVALLGISAGLVVFGFDLWIPSNLRKLGLTEVGTDKVLRNSASIGFPLTFVVAWLYGYWNSKKTLIGLSVITTTALICLAVVGDAAVNNRALLYALLVIPIWGINTLTACIAAYASEVFPQAMRARGSGLAAGASKAGGVLIILLVLLSVAAPSIAATAAIGAVPMAVAALLFCRVGRETQKRPLEQIAVGEYT